MVDVTFLKLPPLLISCLIFFLSSSVWHFMCVFIFCLLLYATMMKLFMRSFDNYVASSHFSRVNRWYNSRYLFTPKNN